MGDSLNGSGQVEVEVAEAIFQDVVDKEEAMLVDVEVPESSWLGDGTPGVRVVPEDAVDMVVGTQALVVEVQSSELFQLFVQTAMVQRWLV